MPAVVSMVLMPAVVSMVLMPAFVSMVLMPAFVSMVLEEDGSNGLKHQAQGAADRQCDDNRKPHGKQGLATPDCLEHHGEGRHAGNVEGKEDKKGGDLY